MGYYLQFKGPFDKLRIAVSLILRQAQTGMFRPILLEAAERTLKYLQREYRGRSRREWKKISPTTRALSRGREGADIKSLKQLSAAARRARPLIDRGETLKTLERGHSFNIFEVSNVSARAGSRSPILAKHQKQHQAAFVYDQGRERDLERNVPKSILGVRRVSRGTATVTGVRGRWNRVFFQLRGAFRKMSGKTVTIPARPLPKRPSTAILNWFQRALAGKLATMLRVAHRSRGR